MKKDNRTPLSQYSIEELKAELMRRRRKKVVRVTKYIEWEGTVTLVHEWGRYSQFKYTVSTEDPRVDLDSQVCIFPLDYRNIKKESRPKVGDKVVLRLRYTKAMEKGKALTCWSLGKIIRVLGSP